MNAIQMQALLGTRTLGPRSGSIPYGPTPFLRNLRYYSRVFHYAFPTNRPGLGPLRRRSVPDRIGPPYRGNPPKMTCIRSGACMRAYTQCGSLDAGAATACCVADSALRSWYRGQSNLSTDILSRGTQVKAIVVLTQHIVVQKSMDFSQRSSTPPTVVAPQASVASSTGEQARASARAEVEREEEGNK
eukprot:3801598-Rhodomonas_salina.1